MTSEKSISSASLLLITASNRRLPQIALPQIALLCEHQLRFEAVRFKAFPNDVNYKYDLRQCGVQSLHVRCDLGHL